MKTRTSLRFGAVIIAVAAAPLALTASAGSNISPKADQIAFMSTFDGEADIYSMTLTGLMNKNLTHDETIGMRTDVEPAWSPTGEYVAFQRNFIKANTPALSSIASLPMGRGSGRSRRPRRASSTPIRAGLPTGTASCSPATGTATSTSSDRMPAGSA